MGRVACQLKVKPFLFDLFFFLNHFIDVWLKHKKLYILYL